MIDYKTAVINIFVHLNLLLSFKRFKSIKLIVIFPQFPTFTNKVTTLVNILSANSKLMS